MTSIDRRRFLVATGAVGVASVAGCLGDDDDEDPSADEPEPGTEDGTESKTGDETDEGETEELPDPTDTETALIEPATLNEWHDAGLVNNHDMTHPHRVAVLRIDDWYPEDGTIQSYEDGHVPGAVPWEGGELHAARTEGLGSAAPMVAPGDVVDEVLVRAGACPRTTIVVSGSKPLRVARGYWTLRYWGFPRERIKVLNGGYHAYGEEYDLETGAFDPETTPDSTFSVQANDELNNDLRVGIAQMIQRVDNLNAGESDDVILENRQEAGPSAPDVMIENAIWDNPLAGHAGDHHFDTFEVEGAYFKEPDVVEAHYDELGVSANDTVITYCGSGYRAAISFFLLDGVLGHDDVMLYDGSWRQWAQYDGNNDDEHTPPDEWRIDLHDRTDGDTGDSDLEILVDEIPELQSAEANQVEGEDLEYMAGGEADDDDADDDEDDWAC